MENDDDKHRTLMKRVVEGEPSSFQRLVLALRPRIRSLLKKRRPDLSHVHSDVAAAAEEVAFGWWLRRDQEKHLRVDEPVGALAWRLAMQVMRRETRRGERVEPPSDGAALAVPAEAEQVLEVEELLRVVDELPAQHREVIEAQSSYSVDGGEAPHVRLGISEGAFRVRLSRARAMLALRLRGRQEEIDRAG